MLVSYSSHAWQRAKERRIERSTVRFIVKHHDQSSPVRGGCRRIGITSERAKSLVQQGFSKLDIQRARGVQVVVRIGEGTVVTVFNS